MTQKYSTTIALDMVRKIIKSRCPNHIPNDVNYCYYCNIMRDIEKAAAETKPTASDVALYNGGAVRIFLITLGYVPNKLFKHTAARLWQTLSGKHVIERIFVAKPYPVDQRRNMRLNVTTAWLWEYQQIHVRHEDAGAAADFNKVLVDIGLRDEDLVFICDHDVFHVEQNWDDAMIRVMRADPQIDWVCLWNDASPIEFGERGGIPGEVDGIRIMQAITPMMAVTSLVRGSFLRYTGGLLQPAKYYGGVEIAMWNKLIERGTKKVFLPDFTEDQRLKEHEDLSYRAWKTEHATGRYAGSFKEWLCAESK